VIVLPATLATFRGLLVRVRDQLFVLPSRHVERVLRVRHADITSDAAGQNILLGDERLALVPLGGVLRLPPRAAEAGARHAQVVVLASGDKRTAFAVDEVIGDEEVLVKPLGAPLQRVPHIAGATVLGEGRVVAVLHVADLLKSAALGDWREGAGQRPQRAGEGASLLVAEDSITARALLQGILESAGFRVTTAADGEEALEALHKNDFDLLITDVEMPRLDGFDLTARLRNDKRLAELPVILVTALDSREDKERGVEVGADAYIVKSSFDQRKLLEAIRTLL
jgi:two-component system chemotaxis sensor kinase CheA